MEENALVYALGLVAQSLFSARMIVQWVMSERARKVVSPTIYWVLSLLASYIFFIYGWLREDFSLMLGQVIGYFSYIWNLKAKGLWNKIFQPWRSIVIIQLVLTPVVAMALLLRNPAEVFETLFNNEQIPLWLVLFGSTGQVIFSFRFLYQAIYSSRKGESLLPEGFWLISLTGATIILVYGIIRVDPVVILAQSFGLVTYIRNLIIWRKSHNC